MSETYRKASQPVEAWQWNGQPESQWPEWLGPVVIALRLGSCDHGWWFIRQPDADRARAVTQGAFARDYIADQSARIDTLEKALGGLLSYVERNTCQHDETHRGGVLWEICDQCGAKWADDVGGRPKFKWHADVTNARAALHPSDNEVKK